MSITIFVFIFFCATILIFSVFMILSKNLVHTAFAFLSVLISIAAIYIFLVAEFVAVSQILIYVGGVLVLLIFGIMLTQHIEHKQSQKSMVYTLLISLLVMMGIGMIAFDTVNNFSFLPSQSFQETEFNSTQQIGIRLLTKEVLPFEISSILLFIALIGAAYISTKKVFVK